MQLVHWILLVSGLVLLFWATLRWSRCSREDVEYSSRRDMALLSVLLLLGVVGDSIRTRLSDVSVPYRALSIGLLPIAVGAVTLLIRLIREYRRLHGRGDSDRGAANGRTPRG